MSDDDGNSWSRHSADISKILAGDWFRMDGSKAIIDAAFSAYTGLEGLRGAFYLGAESYNCSGSIPNEYPLDDPKHKAFHAGYRAAMKLWGG